MAAFQRAAGDGAAPWPPASDIWYSERVVDMHDDIPKWCARASVALSPDVQCGLHCIRRVAGFQAQPLSVA